MCERCQRDGGADCGEITLTPKSPRRLPPVDCTEPQPLKYISGPPFPSWLTAPDRPAEADTPSVDPVYLTDPDDPDGLNLARGIAWLTLLATVALALVGVWFVVR